MEAHRSLASAEVSFALEIDQPFPPTTCISFPKESPACLNNVSHGPRCRVSRNGKRIQNVFYQVQAASSQGGTKERQVGHFGLPICHSGRYWTLPRSPQKARNVDAQHPRQRTLHRSRTLCRDDPN